MKGKHFEVVEKPRVGSGGYIHHNDFFRFSDAVGKHIIEARQKGSCIVVPADGIKLALDSVTLPIKGGDHDGTRPLKMTETFLMQLVSMLGLSPKLFGAIPHDLAVETINRVLKDALSKHVKVRVVGSIATAVMNTKYTFVHIHDTISGVYQSFGGGNGNPEMAFYGGWADSMGTVRTLWFYPKIAAIDSKTGTPVYAGAELLMNIHMVCHPMVTPCVISSSGVALLKARTAAIEPTGTTEQAQNAILAKMRSAKSSAMDLAVEFPKLRTMPLTDDYSFIIGPIKSALGKRGELTMPKDATLMDIFTDVYDLSNTLMGNILKAREGQIVLGTILEEAFGTKETV